MYPDACIEYIYQMICVIKQTFEWTYMYIFTHKLVLLDLRAPLDFFENTFPIKPISIHLITFTTNEHYCKCKNINLQRNKEFLSKACLESSRIELHALKTLIKLYVWLKNFKKKLKRKGRRKSTMEMRETGKALHDTGWTSQLFSSYFVALKINYYLNHLTGLVQEYLQYNSYVLTVIL